MRGTSQFILTQVSSLAAICAQESAKKNAPAHVVPQWNGHENSQSDSSHETLNTSWRKRLVEAASVGGTASCDSGLPAKIQCRRTVSLHNRRNAPVSHIRILDNLSHHFN